MYVLERSGWGESMCDSYFQCVGKYARVSVQ